ncbi:energy-coupling factor ABC transporter ATP-binding protein [Methanoplanus endosymbiosus]|uniref:Energy-coupling factor ABC transporter ATP-binding protein n=1 Tax=Methanoplanus endosymbiosus TaxID=33865 RepID=A0A9E7TIV0_9EURY|nr:energy-coupling factor ABC transporter ATP-binding protein [Methanoplanus endosymbiosus]UUX92953.1 energy-coupling factor ABC transporter ATP-binding protein [Methanoplanus endosymbiosus]
MIEINGLNHGILNIDEAIIPEGITAVAGRNGSGKSTLLKLVSGLKIPDSGSIHIDGKNPRKLDTGYVSEYPDDNSIFGMVYDEIASSLRFKHAGCDETDRRVTEISSLFEISHLLKREIRTLSGGEKVMVALASACADRPDLLVIDEPDSHLDRESAEIFFESVLNTGSEHIIICTHNMETVSKADNMIFLESGRIKFQGTPEEIFANFLKKTCFYPPLWRFKK